jgi:hypothetical protein
MSVALTAGGILRAHTVLEVESIDRMYLNVYVPQLQCDRGVVSFFRYHRQRLFASSADMEPMSKQFVQGLERYAQGQGIPVLTFRKGERKDDVLQEHLRRFPSQEGVLFLGKAQEKARVFGTEKRVHPETGQPYPWIVAKTALVNQWYVYLVDADFGPLFLKFSSYFPYNAKLCINGHEYLKRQLAKEGIAYAALDNGILSCADPARLQAIADGLDAARIEALLRKWLAILPHPFSPDDRTAGYTYAISILQAEFALTQVLDAPRQGRLLFEQIIREHLDLGRPSQVQLIFNRRVNKRTPGRFRTRVITEGVVPSLHIDYKSSRIKQYHKEGRALRTETTINDTRDFGIGKRLSNLPALRQLAFSANRRLLDVQSLSLDPAVGDAAVQQVTHAQVVQGQRVSGLPLESPRSQALFQLLLLFCFLPCGFAAKEARSLLAQLQGLDPAAFTPGRLTYDLRRLRLHGLIERLPGTLRYRPTADGLRIAAFLSRVSARVLSPGLAQILPAVPPANTALRRAFDGLDRATRAFIDEELAA